MYMAMYSVAVFRLVYNRKITLLEQANCDSFVEQQLLRQQIAELKALNASAADSSNNNLRSSKQPEKPAYVVSISSI